MTITRKPRAAKPKAELPTLSTTHPAEQAGAKVHALVESGVTAAVEAAKDVGSLVGTTAGYVGHFFKGLVKGQ